MDMIRCSPPLSIRKHLSYCVALYARNENKIEDLEGGGDTHNQQQKKHGPMLLIMFMDIYHERIILFPFFCIKFQEKTHSNLI